MESTTIIIGVVFAVSILALFALARWDRRVRDRLATQWAHAQGEVIEVWQNGMGSFFIRYRFTPQGAASPITRDEMGGCLRASLPEVGERVPVRYDPEAPTRARLQRAGC